MDNFILILKSFVKGAQNSEVLVELTSVPLFSAEFDLLDNQREELLSQLLAGKSVEIHPKSQNGFSIVNILTGKQPFGDNAMLTITFNILLLTLSLF